MTPIRPTVEALIADLARLGELRVWSVIITIFGDSVLPRGGVVSAAALAGIAERLSIKPEALRVALYRLARDGWIERSKSGRNAFYGLSAQGKARFLPATRRIYAAGPELHGPWRLAALAPGDEAGAEALRGAGFAEITPVLFLGPAQAGAPPQTALVMTGETHALPGWVRDALAPGRLRQDFAALEAHLAGVRQALPDPSRLDPVDAVALRTLVVHRWRRLLLRHADLPAAMLPADWRGEAARAEVRALHAALSPVADVWLDQAIGPRLT